MGEAILARTAGGGGGVKGPIEKTVNYYEAVDDYNLISVAAGATQTWSIKSKSGGYWNSFGPPYSMAIFKFNSSAHIPYKAGINSVGLLKGEKFSCEYNNARFEINFTGDDLQMSVYNGRESSLSHCVWPTSMAMV